MVQGNDEGVGPKVDDDARYESAAARPLLADPTLPHCNAALERNMTST